MSVYNSKQSFWVELRPVMDSEVEVGCFAKVLDVLYGSFLPFKLVIADCVGETEFRDGVVRFFVQVWDLKIKHQLVKLVTGLLDVEVVDAAPFCGGFKVCGELSLEKHCAFSICDLEKEATDNLVDRIVLGLAGLGGMIEITACGNPKLALNIKNHLYKLSNKKGFGFLDCALDAFLEIICPSKTKTNKSFGEYKSKNVDDFTQNAIKKAQNKLSKSLFVCNINIHTNSPKTLDVIKTVLPFSQNKFKFFKIHNKPQPQINSLKKPTLNFWYTTILTRLWLIIPILVVGVLCASNLFNPLKLLNYSPLETTTIAVISIASASLFFLFPKRNFIILNSKELSQIFGIPQATDKLPIALAEVPLSRMQLATDNKHENTQQPR